MLKNLYSLSSHIHGGNLKTLTQKSDVRMGLRGILDGSGTKINEYEKGKVRIICGWSPISA